MQRISILRIAAILFVASTLADQSANGEPLLWYRYGNSGPAQILTDVSGNANDGTAIGAVFVSDRPPGADDIIGVPLSAGSIGFDGNDSSGGWSNARDLLTNAAIQSNGGFTIETWLYRNALNNNTPGGIQKVFQLEVENLFILRDSNQISFSHAFSFATVPVAEWHHVAAVFDSGENALVAGTLSGELRLYLDGDLMLSQSQLLTTDRDIRSERIFIGTGNESDSTWNGRLFETRLTLGALDPDGFLLPSAVPEPGSLTMLAACALTVAAVSSRRGKRKHRTVSLLSSQGGQ